MIRGKIGSKCSIKALPNNVPPPPMKTSAESSGTRNAGPEPMELGTAHHRMLTKEEHQELWSKNACVYCGKANAGHFARDYPLKKKRPGNRGKSLTLTVGASEATRSQTGMTDNLAVGLKTTRVLSLQCIWQESHM